MTPAIETMLSHRSIRKYTDQKITNAQLDLILKSGRAASSSSALQMISVVRVMDEKKRQALVEYSGNQQYVATAAEFLVFCIDYQRHYRISDQIQPEFTELTLIGAIDAGIMAQNMLVAAESLGLGGVYIGGLRNCPHEVDDLLKLPKYCAPLFGLCLGYPDEDPEIKPRLPQEMVVHEDHYQVFKKESLEAYDDTIEQYYARRTNNQKSSRWSKDVAVKLSKESRPFMKDYLESKGLASK